MTSIQNSVKPSLRLLRQMMIMITITITIYIKLQMKMKIQIRIQIQIASLYYRRNLDLSFKQSGQMRILYYP